MDGNEMEGYNREKAPLHRKSYDFAVRVVNMVKYVDCPVNENALLMQVLRSGTAIGALVRESEYAQSPADFINKLHVALKECNETLYWLELLNDTGYIGEMEEASMASDCKELLALLIASIKTTKKRNGKLNNEV